MPHSAGFPVADTGCTVLGFCSAKNVSGAEMAAGIPVRFDMAAKGTLPRIDIDVMNAHAIDHFAGITRHTLADDQESHSCVQCEGGPIKARYKGHASAAALTWAKPVVGQTYLTYSALPTGILLLNTMVADTDVHEINEGAATAKVFILPGALKDRVMMPSPAATDQDGLLDGQTVAAEGEVVLAADMIGLGVLDYPRNISAIAKTNATDVSACDVVFVGTDINGEAITESLTFTANLATVVVGLQAFATLVSVTWPAQDGATATWDVGWVDVLGLPFMCPVAPYVRETRLNGVVEGTVPTLVADVDEVSKNTIDINSACDGNPIDVFFLHT